MSPLGPRGGATGVIPARNLPERVGEGEERAKGVTCDRLWGRILGSGGDGEWVSRRGGALAATGGSVGEVAA
jgi:hypothetical protein